MTYATYGVFKKLVLNDIPSNEFTSTVFATQIDEVEDEVNNDTGKTASSPWTSSDEEYSLVQRAECYLAAHYMYRGFMGGVEDESLDEPVSEEENKTSNYYTEYRRLIDKINDISSAEAKISDPVFRVVESD